MEVLFCKHWRGRAIQLFPYIMTAMYNIDMGMYYLRQGIKGFLFGISEASVFQARLELYKKRN